MDEWGESEREDENEGITVGDPMYDQVGVLIFNEVWDHNTRQNTSQCNIFALFFNDEILNVLVKYFCHST